MCLVGCRWMVLLLFMGMLCEAVGLVVGEERDKRERGRKKKKEQVGDEQVGDEKRVTKYISTCKEKYCFLFLKKVQ